MAKARVLYHNDYKEFQIDGLEYNYNLNFIRFIFGNKLNGGYYEIFIYNH